MRMAMLIKQVGNVAGIFPNPNLTFTEAAKVPLFSEKNGFNFLLHRSSVKLPPTGSCRPVRFPRGF